MQFSKAAEKFVNVKLLQRLRQHYPGLKAESQKGKC